MAKFIPKSKSTVAIYPTEPTESVGFLTSVSIKILKMVEDGKISADEAATLLSALTSDEKNVREQEQSQPHWLSIQVLDDASGKEKMAIRLPLGLINVAMKMGATLAPEVNGLNMKQVVSAIEDGQFGQIVDVYDHNKGERITISVA
ncbi:MAG: hypothetical protein B6242_05950 [Anaerolineaceae bacterium 4572_78]|nr:MAG: hypothetical protein B6242_05950 [Anaerolineaceae bacterium 4572_78]